MEQQTTEQRDYVWQPTNVLSDYLWQTLERLNTETDGKVINALVAELRQKVADAKWTLKLLNQKFSQFESGIDRNNGRVTNKQIDGLIMAIRRELYLLKDPRMDTIEPVKPRHQRVFLSTVPSNQLIITTASSTDNELNRVLQTSITQVENHHLNDILQSTLEQLGDNILDSAWNTIITQMIDQMFTFLTDDELQASKLTIDKILITLQEHKWTGVDFYSPPDKKKFREALASYIKV